MSGEKVRLTKLKWLLGFVVYFWARRLYEEGICEDKERCGDVNRSYHF